MKQVLLVFFLICSCLYGQTDTVVLVAQDVQQITEELNVNTEHENINSKWFSALQVLMYLVIFSIMIFLYNRYKIKSEIHTVTGDELKTDTDNSEINWNNFFKKVGQQPEAEKLYKELIRKSHPDKFPNDDKKISIANKITASLGENKLDLEKLQELRLKINKELLNI
jgi:hypothetical protein